MTPKNATPARPEAARALKLWARQLRPLAVHGQAPPAASDAAMRFNTDVFPVRRELEAAEAMAARGEQVPDELAAELRRAAQLFEARRERLRREHGPYGF